MLDEAYQDIQYSLSMAPSDNDYISTFMRVAFARGDMSLMKEQCQAIIDTYDNHKDDIDLMYAYAYLGQKDKAIEVLNDKVIPGDDFYHYEAACVYSILGDTDKSLELLKQAYDGGFCQFAHARFDQDLVNIRRRPEFEQITKQYEAKLDRDVDEATVAVDLVKVTKTSVIPFTRESGVCKVKCSINGLPLHFFFDTGASSVTISSVEASFMLKNEYIRTSDILGTTRYSTASGDIAEGTDIILREVKFGDFTLTDVRATVTHSQSAPLLLGQTVLSRLGKIEIDNDEKVIRIEYAE